MEIIINSESYSLEGTFKRFAHKQVSDIVSEYQILKKNDKYTAKVTFYKYSDGNYEAEINVLQGEKIVINAQATTTDSETAFDEATKKLQEQILIYIERLSHGKKMEVIVTGSNFRLAVKKDKTINGDGDSNGEDEDYIESSLKQHAFDKLTQLGLRYNKDGCNKIHKLHAVFHKDPGGFDVKIDITEEIEGGSTIEHASFFHPDPYTAFDGAFRKLKTQIEDQTEKKNSNFSIKSDLPIEDQPIEAGYEILGDDEDEESEENSVEAQIRQFKET